MIDLIETAKREIVKNEGTESRDETWHNVAQELYDIRMVLKKYTAMEKELKDKLVTLSNDQSTFNSVYFYERSERMGTLDYAKIVKDYNVETEKYRKEVVVSWKLSKL